MEDLTAVSGARPTVMSRGADGKTGVSFRVTRAPGGKLSGALPGSGASCWDWACIRLPLLSAWILPSPGTLPGAYALHLTTKKCHIGQAYL